MLLKFNKPEPETVESFLESLPHNAEVTFRQAGRYGGRELRIEMKYVQYGNYGRNATERYMYTATNALDCIKKLRKKQNNPSCRVDCTCIHHKEG